MGLRPFWCDIVTGCSNLAARRTNSSEAFVDLDLCLLFLPTEVYHLFGLALIFLHLNNDFLVSIFLNVQKAF